MTNQYLIRRSWKWKKKIFLYLLEFTTLNSCIILASCCSKLSHRLFGLVRGLIQWGGGRGGGCIDLRPQERQAQAITKLKRLDTRHNEHRPWKGTEPGSMCVRLETKLKCPEYNMKLCAVSFFEVCHTKLNFWGPTHTKLKERSTQA